MSLIATLVIVVTVVGSVIASRLLHHQSRIEQALDMLPEQTLIANYTDWRAARDDVASGIDSDSSAETKEGFLDAAYERDYSINSVLSEFEAEMQASYGWTVLDVEWEMYGQSRDGAVAVLKMPDDFDFDAAADQLTRLGYEPADHDGVRRGSDEVLSAITPSLTPELSDIVLLPDDHLIVSSDSADYAVLTKETIGGDHDSLLDVDGVPDMAAPLEDDAVTAVVNVQEHGCVAAGFEAADPREQQLARQRIRSAGGITATDGLALAIDKERRLTVVMHFSSEAEAEDDRAARVALAHGQAPDQGGTFEERFSVGNVSIVGTNLVLRLDPKDSDVHLLSDLGRGGLLFASC